MFGLIAASLLLAQQATPQQVQAAADLYKQQIGIVGMKKANAPDALIYDTVKICVSFKLGREYEVYLRTRA